MIQGHQRERAKSPKHKGVRDSDERPFADDFGLEEDFPNEIPDAFSDRMQPKIGVRLSFADLAQNPAEAQREPAGRPRQQYQKENNFGRRKPEHLLKL